MSEEVIILGTDVKWYAPLDYGAPSEDMEMLGRYLITVLVAGAVGDYAAYQGLVVRQCRMSIQNVARFGDKLSFQVANAIFCNGLDEKKYRV